MSERSGDGWHGSIGGNCPVQGYGVVDGHAWYFRARGEHWALHIAAKGHVEDAVGAGVGVPGWCVWEPWGEEEFGAGYMPDDDAWQMIEKAIGMWRAGTVPYLSVGEANGRRVFLTEENALTDEAKFRRAASA